MKSLRSLFVAGCGIVVALTGCSAVTTDSLLTQMTDMRRLADLPSPAYTTKQFSSYDRKSTTASDAEGWFANGDSGKFIREEENAGRKEYVMADMAGPGAIVRIWSANPEGTLRVYLDGTATPVIEEPMTAALGGKLAEFPEPISGVRSKGWNLYFPIPYARHCKVTSDQKGFYYHVNYRTYAPGTQVVTLKREDLKRLAGSIGQVAAALRSPRQAAEAPGLSSKRPFDSTVPPGGQVQLAQLKGPQAICAMQFQVAASDLSAAARGLVLAMSFDGENTVECPLGDFFGTAPGLSAYDSLPMGITKDEKPVMWCHWFMPFARSAEISVRNLGSQEVKILGGASLVGYEWSSRSMLFHAKWRMERGLPSRPFSDWTHLDCQGNGRFVGGALYVCNPVRGWWGEGDEKIFVDGEAFPCFFGTGSEDYYGYAWCSNEVFVSAYHNQPRCDGPNNFGFTAVNRFHVLDDVPFTSRFKFDMENWHSDAQTTTDRAAVSYWYARPGGTDFYKPITAADVVPIKPPVYQIRHVDGAIEGEKLREITVPGNCRVEKGDHRLSGEEYLLWEKGKPGDKLVLGFDAVAGKKHLLIRVCRDTGCARVQFYLNDVKVGDPLDMYKPIKFRPREELDLGEVELKGGENRLTVEILGANDEAEKKYQCAIDYLKFK